MIRSFSKKRVEARRVHILNKVKDALDRGELPTALSVGLTGAEMHQMDEEGLLTLWRTSDSSEDLSTYTIGRIPDKGLGVIAEASQVHPTSPASRIGKILWASIWDLVKVLCGVVVGWYLKKHFP